MKFMKLGSRPDTFYTSEAIRSVSSEVSTDIIVQVKGTRYMLHKFPLLSKCLHLQRLCSESSSPISIVQLPDFPGGAEAFELCAKFCYGITITLSAHNVVSTRCAAEYLQMTEDVDRGNLVYKLDVFFNSCILQGWKDSVVALQSTKPCHVWSEELGITTRCVEAVASRVPCKDQHWWAEDMAELSIDLYWRTMIVIKSSGKVSSSLIGHALKVYAAKWLPRTSRNKKQDPGSDSDSDSDSNSDSTKLLESIISLLPMETGSVSCRFLMKLLKVSNILKASSSSKMELARRAGLQLEEATVNDLLIPSSSSYSNDTIHDVDIVMVMLEQFMLQGQSPDTSPLRDKIGFERRRRSRSAENIDFEFQERRRSSSASSSHSSKLKVARLVDRYLQEVAKDPNLSMSKFTAMAETIPGFARPDHDDLYRAIDIFLKAHPKLNKSERKRLCRILDCRKLSGETCVDAAQNELLPLRVVVQVLVFEQARAALAGGKVTELPSNLKSLLAAHSKDQLRPHVSLSTDSTISSLRSPKSTLSTLRVKLAEDEDLEEGDLDHNGIEKSTKFLSFCALPTRPRRMFSKFWFNGSVKR